MEFGLGLSMAPFLVASMALAMRLAKYTVLGFANQALAKPVSNPQLEPGRQSRGVGPLRQGWVWANMSGRSFRGGSGLRDVLPNHLRQFTLEKWEAPKLEHMAGSR